MSTKPSNPKDLIGVKKVPLRHIPPIALAWLGLAMEDGALKYDPFNYREYPVQAGVYYEAALRHLLLWFDGEELDPKTGVHHLAYVMGCCAILLDCQSIETLIDDRPRGGGLPEFMERKTEERTQDEVLAERMVEMKKRLAEKTGTNEKLRKMYARYMGTRGLAEAQEIPGVKSNGGPIPYEDMIVNAVGKVVTIMSDTKGLCFRPDTLNTTDRLAQVCRDVVKKDFHAFDETQTGKATMEIIGRLKALFRA